jgi:hypothetical protein
MTPASRRDGGFDWLEMLGGKTQCCQGDRIGDIPALRTTKGSSKFFV